MAWFRNYRYNKNRKRRWYGKRRQSRSDRLTRLSYDLAQVNTGLQNPDSRISASYDAGKAKVNQSRKPLF